MSFQDYVGNYKKEQEELQSFKKSWNKEVKFLSKLAELTEKIDVEDWIRSNYCKYPKTSEFMLNVFDKNDWVWVNSDPIVVDIQSEMKDMDSWAKSKKSLDRYVYYVINPFSENTSRAQDKIKKFKYMLFESDDLSKKEQLVIWIDLINAGLPVKMITNSGNKSYHAIVKVPEGISSVKEYEAYTAKVFEKMTSVKTNLIDEACKNPGRLSRIPFGVRNDEKTNYTDVEQSLLYIQPDDSLLTNDALDVVTKWVNSIVPTETLPTKSREVDEISEDEILAFFKDRDLVHDIWDDGKDYHTFQKLGEIDENGKTVYRYADKKWANKSSFWNFIRQTLNEQYQTKFEEKEIRKLEVRFKNEYKRPYIGEKHSVKKDNINTFIPGWLHEALNDKKIPSELNEPLEQMLDNLFGPNIVERKWVLQWMREFMHTFNVITAPVFWQPQGTGKTMLSKAFGEAIGDWIKTPPKKDDIQFNAWQDHTVIIFEESSSGNKRDGKDLGDLLKDWITESQKTIEGKGKDPVKKTIQSCYIFNANISDNVAPVFIENGDRRYTIIKNEYAVNLKDLWSDKDFEMWNNGTYKKQLMKYIYNLPVDPEIDIRKGILNQAKSEVIDLGKNNVEIAIEAIAETFNGFISCGELIDLIKTEYGVSSTARGNGNILKKLGYESRLRKIKNKVIRGYIFNHNQDESDLIDIFPEA